MEQQYAHTGTTLCNNLTMCTSPCVITSTHFCPFRACMCVSVQWFWGQCRCICGGLGLLAGGKGHAGTMQGRRAVSCCVVLRHVSCLGLARTTYIRCISVLLAGNFPNLRLYTVYVYGSGQPYSCRVWWPVLQLSGHSIFLVPVGICRLDVVVHSLKWWCVSLRLEVVVHSLMWWCISLRLEVVVHSLKWWCIYLRLEVVVHIS